MSLAERRGLRLFAFCVLYVAQGIPWGFTAITLPAYLAGKHLGTQIVASTLTMTTLPYTFKIVWAPIIDALPSRRFGRRRPWIVGAQLMMALTIGTMIAIPDLTRDVGLLAWMILINTTFSSIQDLSTDALAVDLLDEDERGRVNGLMYASKYFGGILGGAGMSTLIAWSGMRAALAAQTGVLLAIMLVPLLARERAAGSEPPAATVAIGERFAALWHDVVELRRCAGFGMALRGAGVMLVSSIGNGLLAAVSPVLFTQDLGWSSDRYAELTGGLGLAAGCAGAILGGYAADKIGHRKLAAIGAAMLGAAWIAWAALAAHWSSTALVDTLVVVEPLAQSLMIVPLFAVCMDLSWPKIGATQFGIYMAIANLSTTIGFKLAGLATDWWTYRGVYVAGAVLQLGVIAAIGFVDPRAVRRALAVA